MSESKANSNHEASREGLHGQCLRDLESEWANQKQITSQVSYLEMSGTYSIYLCPHPVKGIYIYIYKCRTCPVAGAPINVVYKSCKGYLLETFNSIEVKHASELNIW